MSILTRKEVEAAKVICEAAEFHFSMRKENAQQLFRTIETLVELVKRLADHPCRCPQGNDAIELGEHSGDYIDLVDHECPPCRARAFLKEWRRE